MPTYNFINNDTGDEFEEFMGISEMEQYLLDNTNITLSVSAPAIVSGVPKKPDSGFRDILNNIKKGNSKGLTSSSINTF